MHAQVRMILNYRSDESPKIPSPLPQSVGYGVVVVAGLAFAFGMHVSTETNHLEYKLTIGKQA